MHEMITENGFTFQAESDGTLSVAGYQGKEIDITIPERVGGSRVASLVGNVFCDNNRIMTINVPAGLTCIAQNAFDHCGSLQKIVVNTNNTVYSSLDGVLYNKAGDTIIRYPCNKSDRNYLVPEQVRHIGAGAFAKCRGFSALTLPEELISIGRESFSACTWLSFLDIPETCLSIGAWAFSGCWKMANIILPPIAIIEAGVFSYCSALSQLRLHEGIRVIGDDAFSCCNRLTYVGLPDTLVRIGDRAFYECRSLTEMRLPAGLEEVGEGAFYGCGALRKLVLSQGVRAGTGAFPDTTMLAYRGS